VILDLPFLVAPSIAPTVKATRISATEIEANWNEIPAASVGRYEVYTYHLKCHFLSPYGTRLNSSTTILETNQTSYLISGLSPGLIYVISVAAGDDYGVGVFSEEVVVECKQTMCCMRMQSYLGSLAHMQCLKAVRL